MCEHWPYDQLFLMQYVFCRCLLISVCQLSVNENRGMVKPYTDWNANKYLRFAHLPVKPNNDYYTISDIIANSEAVNGDVISIMAVVKRVSEWLMTAVSVVDRFWLHFLSSLLLKYWQLAFTVAIMIDYKVLVLLNRVLLHTGHIHNHCWKVWGHHTRGVFQSIPSFLAPVVICPHRSCTHPHSPFSYPLNPESSSVGLDGYWIGAPLKLHPKKKW